MIYLAAAAAVAAFVIGFQLTGIVATAGRIVALARRATSVMRNPDMDDEAKEKAIQKSALSMMAAAVSIFFRVVATLVLTVLPIYLFHWLGLAERDDVIAFLARLDVIVGATLIVGGGAWLWSRRPKSPESAYSTMDRLVHRLAFAAPFVQATAADIEDSMFAKDIADIPERPPIFITSVPRAGTTIVLNALHALPQVATHLYRDMPFVMSPLLWSRVSGGFQKDATEKERAHGDGIKVGFDSPEAFEEIIWRHFWPAHFRGTQIDPWTAQDQNSEATDFLKTHFRKIIALRSPEAGRYVSKNNGNIARLPLLRAMFPEASIIVPLRDPAEHAASLLRQHLNFLDQHARDPFIKRYMHDIGHLEFGALHRPIGFTQFHALRSGHDPRSLDYWLAYWIAAMAPLAQHDDVIIVTDTALQEKPQQTMHLLCDRIGLAPGDVDFKQFFRKIDRKASDQDFDADLIAQARKIYAELSQS